MKRLIDEYGLAILYAIIGAFCLVLFGMIFLGDNTQISSVVTNVVDNSTNSNLNVTYKINYDLAGGYIVLDRNQPYGTLVTDNTNDTCDAYKCNIYDISKIKIDTGEMEEGNPVYLTGNPDDSGASYYLTENNSKLWVTYTRDKSYSIPQATNKTEGSYTLWFDGWSGTGLSQKVRTLVIPKGSTGNRIYTANWTRGKYRIIYNSNIANMKNFSSPYDYKKVVDSGYNIESWLSGNTPDQMTEYGTHPSISTNGYNLLGHVFVGWCKNAFTCTGSDIYKAGTSIDDDLAAIQTSEDDTVKTVVMYAQWEPIVYKINYVNDQEGVVNTNRSSYTILDEFELAPAQLPEWSGGKWYTVNPYTETYSENNIGWCDFTGSLATIEERIASATNCKKADYTDEENTRSKYLFGTYSYHLQGAEKVEDTKLYLFQNFNKITDSERVEYSSMDDDTVIRIGVKETSDEYELKDVPNGTVTWAPQKISYGTYGNLTLYSYLDKYYDLAFIYTYVEWQNSTEKGVPVWTPVEKEQELIGVYRIKNGTESPTKDEMSQIVARVNEALKSDSANKVVGYTFDGFQSEKGRKIFNVDGSPYEQATEFWTTNKTVDENSGDKTKKVYWTYVGGENTVKVFVSWEPLTYLIRLHSNY